MVTQSLLALTHGRGGQRRLKPGAMSEGKLATPGKHLVKIL